MTITMTMTIIIVSKYKKERMQLIENKLISKEHYRNIGVIFGLTSNVHFRAPSNHCCHYLGQKKWCRLNQDY